MDWLEAHWWQVIGVAVVVLLAWIGHTLSELRQDVVEVYRSLWLFPQLKGRAERAREMRENGAFPELTRPKETR